METITNLPVELRDPKELKPAEYNPRKISDAEFEKLKANIARFGIADPLIVNKDLTIIGGHQRQKAALALEMTQVPVKIVDLNKEEEKILNLALNRIKGEWEPKKLAEVIYTVRTLPDIDHSGFTDKEISQLLDSLINPEDDSPTVAPAEKAEPTSKLGDLYQLGPHRLLVGDATKYEDVARLMDGAKADMVWTDPPYNVNYESTKEELGSILNDNMSDDSFNQFLADTFNNYAAIMRPGAVIYCCCGWSSYAHFQKQIKGAGFKQSGCIIWVKNQSSMGWNDYRYKHEWVVKGEKEHPDKKPKPKAVSIFYGWKEGPHYFRDTRDEYDVWEADRKSSAKYVHPTEKPDWLVTRAIKNSSKAGENVVDLFTGSGSALIACEKTGRNFYGMELDPRFADVIIKRYEAYTGQKAVKL